jgi:cytoskeleton protein RodZ
MSETVTVPAPAATEAPGTTPGRRLAQERERQNLSAADVARQLKLSVSQVEALEAGHYHLLPGPVFVRGFIRNYARLVKLDSEPLLQSAADGLPQPAPRPEMPPSQDIPFPAAPARSWPRYAVAFVIIVVALGIYEYGSEIHALVNRPVKTAPVAASPQPHKAASISAPAQTEQYPVHTAAATEPQPEEPGVKASAAAAAAVQEARPPMDAGASETRQPRRGERQVRIYFDKESWVEIRDRNDKTIFYQLNRPGTEQVIHGLPPLTLVVGNAHGVRLTYDEKPVDLARHTKVDVARFTLP